MSALTKNLSVRTAALFGGEMENPLEPLQFCFGDLVQGKNGVVKLIQIDEQNHFVSWGRVEEVVEVFAGDDLIGGWTLSYESNPDLEIAEYSVISFAQQESRKLTAKVLGVVDHTISGDNHALKRADHLIEYLITYHGYTLDEVVDVGTWNRLKKEVTQYSIFLRGVINTDDTFINYFSEMLHYFFLLNQADGRIHFFLSNQQFVAEPGVSIQSTDDAVSLRGTITLKNMANLINVDYQYNWASSSYDAQSGTIQNSESVQRYGEQSYTFAWKWGYGVSLAQMIALRNLSQYHNPQLILEASLPYSFSSLDFNAPVLITAEEMPYLDGRKFVNAFCFCLSLQYSSQSDRINSKFLFAWSHLREYRILGKAAVQTTITAISGNTITLAAWDARILPDWVLWHHDNVQSGSQTIAVINNATKEVTLNAAFPYAISVGDIVILTNGQHPLYLLGSGEMELGGSVIEEARPQFV